MTFLRSCIQRVLVHPAFPRIDSIKRHCLLLMLLLMLLLLMHALGWPCVRLNDAQAGVLIHTGR